VRSRVAESRSAAGEHSDPSGSAAAQTVHARCINVVPWVCFSACTAVVGNMLGHENHYHLSQTYTEHLAGDFQTALALVVTPS
jgi:hypothetical protein